MIGRMTRGGLFSAMFCLSLAHADESEVLGLWSGGDSLLEVAMGADGLSMRILALKDPFYGEEEGLGEPGAARRDDNNPDPTLQARPLVGMELLSGFRYTGKRWEGKIYDPGSGNTYSSRMELDGKRLKMRGYVGVPMFGRTQYFEPIADCSAPVLAMVRESEAELALCD
ncbi:MAG: DUF2147 domain-containing protein [Pseudomonadota bacterium]